MRGESCLVMDPLSEDICNCLQSGLVGNLFFLKQKAAYEMRTWLEFRRVLFRSEAGAWSSQALRCFSGGGGRVHRRSAGEAPQGLGGPGPGLDAHARDHRGRARGGAAADAVPRSEERRGGKGSSGAVATECGGDH